MSKHLVAGAGVQEDGGGDRVCPRWLLWLMDRKLLSQGGIILTFLALLLEFIRNLLSPIFLPPFFLL